MYSRSRFILTISLQQKMVRKSSRLRDKSAIYKNIPMTHNKNNVAVKKKLVYIRYQNKYMELIKKVGIIIEPEELGKAINDDSDKDTLE